MAKFEFGMRYFGADIPIGSVLRAGKDIERLEEDDKTVKELEEKKVLLSELKGLVGKV